jgi:hypothetical protein
VFSILSSLTKNNVPGFDLGVCVCKLRTAPTPGKLRWTEQRPSEMMSEEQRARGEQSFIFVP